MAQNIIYSPWAGTKRHWLCSRTTLSLLFGLLCLFSLVSTRSCFSNQICSSAKVFLQTKCRLRTWGTRTTGSCSLSKAGKNTQLVHWASLVAQSVNHLSAMQETQVWFLDREDPLEKEMASYSGILAWRILWTKEPGGLLWGHKSRTRHSD